MYIYTGDPNEWIKVGAQSDDTEYDPPPGFDDAIKKLKDEQAEGDGGDLDGWDDSVFEKETVPL